LQTPSVPQVLEGCCSHSLAGSWPSAIGVQVPAELVTLQAWQTPVQALLQQMPSAQKPELHCPAAVQAAPLVSSGASAGAMSGVGIGATSGSASGPSSDPPPVPPPVAPPVAG
jgi:hypothetical protein